VGEYGDVFTEKKPCSPFWGGWKRTWGGQLFQRKHGKDQPAGVEVGLQKEFLKIADHFLQTKKARPSGKRGRGLGAQGILGKKKGGFNG